MSKKDPKALDALTTEDIEKLPDAEIGNGNAAFFGEPTEEEQLDFEREERGEKGWFDRLKKLV